MWNFSFFVWLYREKAVILQPRSSQYMNTVSNIEQLIGGELQDFREHFAQILESNHPTLSEVGTYLLEQRGKQLRPMLVILAAKLCGDVNEKTIGSAAAFELLHTASLVHDDVVDDSPLRRGKPSVQARWTNKVAVLSGDYLLAKVIAETARLRNLKLFNIVAEIGQTLASGELLQLHTNGSMWITEEDYYRIIQEKTASLFAACTQAGAVSAGASNRMESALRTFGLELGMVFQMKDDLLDYSESGDSGKPTMQDIRDGKATLPLLISLSRAPKTEADSLKAIVESGHPDMEQSVLSFVLRYDGIRYVQQQMEVHKRKAIEALSVFPDSSLKAAMIQILEYTITRIK